ncbi:DnaT-like ssDNA-binding protein [Sphingobium sp. KCTC 72723]|uniref:DnaT-like ssDNA-binding protein n=1 Tax=Sphingobium sp. KCTC 72723 TaxID=2733867 RepID=UPI00165E8280|nr:DnaT-like ssDNA-binding protein [Sphingobium sp. KCTC 72723]
MTDTAPALIVGTNSYTTLAQANEVATSRLFAAPWHAANDATRAKAIITATAILDNMRWQGRKLAPTQPLAWPRVPSRAVLGYPLAVDIVPSVVGATVDLAIHLLASGGPGGGPAIMQRMLGDSMVMYYASTPDELPKHVRRQIEPYLYMPSAHNAEVQF